MKKKKSAEEEELLTEDEKELEEDEGEKEREADAEADEPCVPPKPTESIGTGGDVVREETEWGKKVEEAMRGWIETEDCERDFSDTYFGNPPERQREFNGVHLSLLFSDPGLAPTGGCCDRPRCSRNVRVGTPTAESSHSHADVTQPSTPTNQSDDEPGSVHSTPSKSQNANGKRPMRRSTGDGPLARRGEHLKNVKLALQRWRLKLARERYRTLTPAGVLPDEVLSKLASNARIRTVENVIAVVGEKWMLAARLGEEVLALLKRYDDDDKLTRAADALARKEEKAAEKKRRDEEKARLKEVEKAANRAQREMSRKRPASLGVAHTFTPPASDPLESSSRYNVLLQVRVRLILLCLVRETDPNHIQSRSRPSTTYHPNPTTPMTLQGQYSQNLYPPMYSHQAPYPITFTSPSHNAPLVSPAQHTPYAGLPAANHNSAVSQDYLQAQWTPSYSDSRSPHLRIPSSTSYYTPYNQQCYAPGIPLATPPNVNYHSHHNHHHMTPVILQSQSSNVVTPYPLDEQDDDGHVFR